MKEEAAQRLLHSNSRGSRKTPKADMKIIVGKKSRLKMKNKME